MNGCVLQPKGKVVYDAAYWGRRDEVEAAVDAGASMEWANSDRWGQRAVAIASERGHKDVVAFLGSRGADVNAVDDYQQTPLHGAAIGGKASVCTTLLALGADPAAKDEDGKTALDQARSKNKPECVAVLTKVVPVKVAEALAAVAAAVASGDRAKVAAAQKVLEEVAATAGTAVRASFRFLSLRVRSKHTGWNSWHFHVSCSQSA
eukprot:COSAG06_NODE_151_length_21964_cov_95.963961_12_plen_206_part_00